MPPERWFLGTRFHALGMAGTLALMQARDPADPFVFISTPNAQHVVRIQQGHAGNGAANDRAWLSLCDSRVLQRMALLLFGLRLPLVLGSDLTSALFAGIITPNEPVTVIGGDATLEAALRDGLGLNRLALFDPPMGFWRDPAEVERAADFVATHPARFVFLACGAPQSEMLALRIQDRGDATGIGLCIGASLKFVTGQVLRAPRWIQRAGLEWLHRLLQEPGRLRRRFLTEQLPVLRVALNFRLRPGFASNQRRRDLWH